MDQVGTLGSFGDRRLEKGGPFSCGGWFRSVRAALSGLVEAALVKFVWVVFYGTLK